MAPTPFSLPLAHLLVLSTKTVDDKRVKELINKWQTKGDKEESTIILSDRCYRSLGRQQEQKDCSEGDFHCLKTLIHKDRETSSSEVWMGIQSPYRSLFCLWRSLFWGFFVLWGSYCVWNWSRCPEPPVTSCTDQLYLSMWWVYFVCFFGFCSCCGHVGWTVVFQTEATVVELFSMVCLFACISLHLFYCRTWWSTSILACRSSSL